MKCPKCQKKAEALIYHPMGTMCSECAIAVDNAKLVKGEMVHWKSEEAIKDLVKAETDKGYAAGAALVMPPKPATQMSMYQELAPHFEEQFLTEKSGAVCVDYTFNENQKNPLREMWVGYFDRKKKIHIMHAMFSCS